MPPPYILCILFFGVSNSSVFSCCPSPGPPWTWAKVVCEKLLTLILFNVLILSSKIDFFLWYLSLNFMEKHIILPLIHCHLSPCPSKSSLHQNLKATELKLNKRRMLLEKLRKIMARERDGFVMAEQTKKTSVTWCWLIVHVERDPQENETEAKREKRPIKGPIIMPSPTILEHSSNNPAWAFVALPRYFFSRCWQNISRFPEARFKPLTSSNSCLFSKILLTFHTKPYNRNTNFFYCSRYSWNCFTTAENIHKVISTNFSRPTKF